MKTVIALKSNISHKCIFTLSTIAAVGFIIFLCQHMIEGCGYPNFLLYYLIVSCAQWLQS